MRTEPKTSKKPRLTEWRDGHGSLVRGDGYTELARYEDTGLDPKGVEELKEAFEELLTGVSVHTSMKQMFYQEPDGRWYSRYNGNLYTTKEAVDEALKQLQTF